MNDRGWYGVDLDGTLARYDGWQGPEHIGVPVPRMLHRVLDWLNAGCEVRIVTARVSQDEDGSVRRVIEAWCMEHLGRVIPITNAKDYNMIELWDDRAVQVVPNTGERVDGQ